MTRRFVPEISAPLESRAMPSVVVPGSDVAHVHRPALASQPIHAQGYPASFFQQYLLGRYTFNGTPSEFSKKGLDFYLKNTTYFQQAALNLNGNFISKPNGYQAIVGAPILNFDSFSVAMTYKAGTPPMYLKPSGGLVKMDMPLVVAGEKSRWFSVWIAGNGNLRVSLNDHKQDYEAPAAFKPPLGKWSTLVCGVDLPSNSLTAYLNGKKLLDLQLPQGFKYNFMSWKIQSDQKQWMFQDIGNSSAYHGLVGDFSYFNTKLPNDAMQQLSAVIKP